MDGMGRAHTGRRALTAALLAVTALGIAPHAVAEAATKKRPATARLAPFDSCADLAAYARANALAHPSTVAVTFPSSAPTPGGGVAEDGAARPLPAAAPTAATPEAGTTAEPDFSGTNNQEAGVDEPDRVKTDGRRIFTLGGGRLQAVAVSADGRPSIRGSLDLGDAGIAYGGELLLHGNRLLVLGTRSGFSAQDAAKPTAARRSVAFPGTYRSSAVILEVDVRDPAAMTVVRSLTVDGSYVSARATGDVARVVITSPPAPVEIQPASSQEEFETRRREAIRNAPVDGFRPKVAITRNGQTTVRGALPCSAIRHPRVFSGLDTTSVFTIDLDKGLPEAEVDAVLGGGDTVYASTSGLYVASNRWDEQFETTGRPGFGTTTTQLHRFATGERTSTTYRASGSVRGYLLNQFSLSEHRGVLRVATTEDPVSFGDAQTESSSTLTVLDERDGVLTPIGRVGGLGRGERIYSARFVDDVAYVVTFRQVDPLYTVDLRDPRAPKVLGELKILGYSAYLHPVGEDTILGVGQDASPQGRRQGTQLSLFDVSDLRNPRLLHQAKVGGSSSSSVEYDHRAFLWWAPRRTAVLPVTLDDGAGFRQATTAPAPSIAPAPRPPFAGVLGYRVTRANGIGALGRMSDPGDGRSFSGGITRTLVFGGRLVTISDRGVGVGSLGDFKRSGFVAFPTSDGS
ncbi:hypothetical protein GKE82_13185 [Conexibacter sp. W3-3-2]|nr:hypothetical protein [Conexibacter sp. W3-3-2]